MYDVIVFQNEVILFCLALNSTNCMTSLFYRGKEEIIGREIREFMENNKALEKELIEETGVSQTEITKYLQESVHLKEEKRTKLFRWYLEKKLSRTESGTAASFTWRKYQFFLLLLYISLLACYENVVIHHDSSPWSIIVVGLIVCGYPGANTLYTNCIQSVLVLLTSSTTDL